MKKVIYLIVIISTLTFLVTSCNKDENNISETAITDDVADEIASSVGESNSGLSSEITGLAELANEYPEAKLAAYDTIYSVDTSFVKANPAGTVTTFSYAYQMEYGFVMYNGVLNNIYYQAGVDGNYDAPRISGASNGESNWVLTGLQMSSQEYVFNGTTSRTGSSQSKVRNKSQITSSSNITLSNVKVNKSTLVIEEGTLSWTISGTVNGQTYSYSAVLVYSGNGKAELTINGMNYTINISSGEVE